MFKKILFLFLTAALVLSACSTLEVHLDQTPTQTVDAGKVATVVAATLAAIPSVTIAPTSTSTSEPISTPNLTLDDFSNKEFIGENEHYGIYLINPANGNHGKTGGIIVYDKSTNLVIKMNGTFEVFGATLVYDDGKGGYILLSIGTSTSRGAIVLSLSEQKQAVKEFCTSSGKYLFWKNYILISNCDTFKNRPWGVGEAPSITAINLETGLETVIAKSDATHQYGIKQIDGNTLQYREIYVENETDWKNQDAQKSNEKAYDLALLENK